MGSKYSPDVFEDKTPKIQDEKYYPFILDSNPFPRTAGLGLLGDNGKGRIFPGEVKPETPFSIDLRDKEIKKLNSYMENLTATKEAGIIWLCGKRGVGKTSLLEYYFRKPLISEPLAKKSIRWYITYDRREDTKFLVNPFKYILEQLHKNLIRENARDKIFHDALVGAIYNFLINKDVYEIHKTYLSSHWSDLELLQLKKNIELQGAEYLSDYLNNADETAIEKIIKLLQVIKDANILNVDIDYLNRFLIPFVRRKLAPDFLSNEARGFLVPASKGQQEQVLINTVKFLTSGAFSHFILVLDQIDVAWKASKNAPKRKEGFFDQISSIVRQLHGTGFILILAVMEEAKKEIEEFTTSKSDEATRVLSHNKNFINVPEIQSIEEVEILLKEYLSKNNYRILNKDELKRKTQEYGTPADLFPFDSSGCAELLKRSNRTTNDVIEKALQALDATAEKLFELDDSKKNSYSVINAKVVEEFVKPIKIKISQNSQ